MRFVRCSAIRSIHLHMEISYATKMVRIQMNSYQFSFASITIAHVMILNGNSERNANVKYDAQHYYNALYRQMNEWLDWNKCIWKKVYSSHFSYVSTEHTAIFIEFTMPCMLLISKTLQTYFRIESKSNRRLCEPMHIAMRN